ncbi:MAG: hypothetical protein REI45_14620 [Propionicimonas sp.]|nr:hypothetical protein [Propionicimonas sp.]
MNERRPELPIALADELILSGQVEELELLRTAVALRATPVRDHLWTRSVWGRPAG